METKKNPSKDVHRYHRPIFLLSLGISLAIVITAIEWQSRKKPSPDPTPPPVREDYMVASFIPVTEIKPDIPKAIKPPKVFDLTRVEPAETISESNAQDAIDFEPVDIPGPITIITPELPIELIDTTFILVEKMPEPVGGYDKFYQHLRKNMRYPSVARRNDREGTVMVQFIVNETGELNNFKILKSVGAGCDEEAIRVLSLSKWSAGKQRGRPVKVLMQQAITFRLN